MQTRVSGPNGRLLSCALVGLALSGAATVASAQTTVTLNQPTTHVVSATVRGGSYANKTDQSLLATRAADNLEFNRRALLKFDTQNTIPAGSNVTSALLTVTVKTGSEDATRVIGAYQVTTSWTETEVTWNRRRSGSNWSTAGGDLGSRLDAATVSNAAGTKVTFDVTPLVRDAVAGRLGTSRYTRVALLDDEGSTSESYREYFTPKDSNTAARPVLRVTYGGSAPAPPPPPPSPTGGNTLRILEFNVYHGGRGTDGVYDPNRIANWIVKSNPDIVSLVEVESRDSYESGDGVAKYKALLEQKTGATWYAWDIQDYGDWTAPGMRNVIYSKLPFISTYRHEFSVGRDRTVGGVTVNVNGRNINIMSTHFDPYSQANRLIQAKEHVCVREGFRRGSDSYRRLQCGADGGRDRDHHGRVLRRLGRSREERHSAVGVRQPERQYAKWPDRLRVLLARRGASHPEERPGGRHAGCQRRDAVRSPAAARGLHGQLGFA